LILFSSDLIVNIGKGKGFGKPASYLKNPIRPDTLDGDGVLYGLRNCEFFFLQFRCFDKRFDNRHPSLYLEGLKLAHLGLSSIYLYICRKLLQFRQREKRVVNAKKRSSQPEKSGENSASADDLRISVWTSTVKPFFGFYSKKPANPHEY
ncbi:MAG TPA: hypothetical protein H9691_03880, partial [Firmicutes bacterium]|nr:hypothetical protein [Bacillota bacterium]